MSLTASGMATLKRVAELAIEDHEVSLPDPRAGETVNHVYYVLSGAGVNRMHLLLVSAKCDRRPAARRRPREAA